MTSGRNYQEDSRRARDQRTEERKPAEYRGEKDKGKPAFNAGEKKKENHGIPRGTGQRKAGIQCRGKEERKPAEYRGEQDKRKRRDVDVRKGRGMVAGLTRKWASTTPNSGLAGSLFGGWGFGGCAAVWEFGAAPWFGGYLTR